MKTTDNASLDQLFRSARQQPPLVQVQQVQQLLARATVAAAGAGLAAAVSTKGAAAAKGAAVANTAGFTSQSIAMLATIMSSALIGSGLWLQHVYVQSGNGNQAPQPGKAVTEIPFSISPGQDQNEPAENNGKGRKAVRKEAGKATGVTYSFPGSSPLPSAAPKAGAAKPQAAPVAPNQAQPPAPDVPAAAPAAAAMPARRAVAPCAPAPCLGKAGATGVAGKPGLPGTAAKAGQAKHPCGSGRYTSYYSAETKTPQKLNTQGVAGSRYLQLPASTLSELGITVTGAAVEYKRFVTKMCPGETSEAGVNNGNGNMLLGSMLNVRFSGQSDIHLHNDKALLTVNQKDYPAGNTVYPWFITEANGKQRVKYKLQHEPDEKLNTDYFTQVQHQLVPVVVESQHGLEGRIVFWFPISEAFLAALPESASRPLRELHKAGLAAQGNPAEAAAKPEAQEEPAKAGPAISNLSSASQLELYPNPTRNHINLQGRFLKDDHLRIQLLDAKGRLVKELQPEQRVQQGSWSRSYTFGSLSPGIYLVVLQSESGEQWNQRLVVTE